MKKRAIVFVTLIALVVSLLTPISSASAGSFSSGSVTFKVGSTTYKLGTSSTTWKSKLGKYKRSTSDGCTTGSTAYTYKFSSKGITVETLVKKKTGKETVIGAVITGKSVGTSAGLKVGSTLEKMVELYGDDYSKSGSDYKYSSGGKRMNVKISSGKVTKITLLQ